MLSLARSAEVVQLYHARRLHRQITLELTLAIGRHDLDEVPRKFAGPSLLTWLTWVVVFVIAELFVKRWVVSRPIPCMVRCSMLARFTIAMFWGVILCSLGRLSGEPFDGWYVAWRARMRHDQLRKYFTRVFIAIFNVNWHCLFVELDGVLKKNAAHRHIARVVCLHNSWRVTLICSRHLLNLIFLQGYIDKSQMFLF